MNFLQTSARKLQDVAVASNRKSASLAPRLPPRAKSSAPVRTIPTRRLGHGCHGCWKNGTPQRHFFPSSYWGNWFWSPIASNFGGDLHQILPYDVSDNRFMDRQKWGPFFMPYITRGQRLVLHCRHCNWNLWKNYHLYVCIYISIYKSLSHENNIYFFGGMFKCYVWLPEGRSPYKVVPVGWSSVLHC